MHAEMLELMHQVLDAETAPSGRAHLEAHIAACDECAHAWASLNSVHVALVDSALLGAPPHLAHAVTKRLALEAEARSVRWERARLAVAFSLLALVPSAMLLSAAWFGASNGEWRASLSALLSLIQWAVAWTALLGMFVRSGLALLGIAPLVASVLLSLGALAVWAYLLDTGAARVRLNGGIGGQT